MTLLLLLAYLASVLAIGIFQRQRAGKDEASYFVAGRSLNTFWGFIGLASLTTGGSTTVALAAFVYVHGLSGLWLDFSGALGLFALALLLARRVFFFQAKDGIRVLYVTGVQTCALPISRKSWGDMVSMTAMCSIMTRSIAWTL